LPAARRELQSITQQIAYHLFDAPRLRLYRRQRSVDLIRERWRKPTRASVWRSFPKNPIRRSGAIQIPKAQTARPEQFVNTTFLRELDSAGFIDRLYKATPAVAATRNKTTP
jgi:hypothetical protein